MRRLLVLLIVMLLPAVVLRSAGAQSPHEEAFAAALRIFDAVPDDDCLAGNNPLMKTCIAPGGSPEGVARGIAHFNLIAPSRQEGALGALGRTPTGEWGFILITQAPTYQRLVLPGEMIVCAEGAGLNIRVAPSVEAEVVAVLPDLTQVWAEEFVLTEPGRYGPGMGPRWGAGWYRLSAPVEGWGYSRYLSTGAMGSIVGVDPCALRERLQPEP